jgi:uncharacterized phage-associated protein
MTFTDAVTPSGEPSLDQKSLSAFLAILDAASKKKLLITRTKLVKLLYLLDLKQVASGREPATTIEWRWLQHGPYSNAIYFAERRLCNDGYINSEEHQWSSTKGHVLTLIKPKYVSPEPDILARIDEVISEFGSLTPTQIKDHTYQTAPMLAAQIIGERDVLLNMKLARPRVNLQKVSARYAIRRVATHKHPFNDAEAQSALLRVMADSAQTRERANKILGA